MLNDPSIGGGLVLAGGLCGRRRGDEVLEIPFGGRLVRVTGLPAMQVTITSPEAGRLIVRSRTGARVDVEMRLLGSTTFTDGPSVEWVGDAASVRDKPSLMQCGAKFDLDAMALVLDREGPEYSHAYRMALDAVGGAAGDDMAAMLATILCEEVARLAVRAEAWRFMAPYAHGEDNIVEALTGTAIGDAILRSKIAPCGRCGSSEPGGCSIALNGGRVL